MFGLLPTRCQSSLKNRSKVISFSPLGSAGRHRTVDSVDEVGGTFSSLGLGSAPWTIAQLGQQDGLSGWLTLQIQHPDRPQKPDQSKPM